MPKALGEHLVNIKVVASVTQVEAKVERVCKHSLPADLKKAADLKNATDMTVFKITTEKDETIKGVLNLHVEELFKRRHDPFPSTIGIKDEQSVKFVDSLYFVSIYPTKSQKTQFTHNTNSGELM